MNPTKLRILLATAIASASFASAAVAHAQPAGGGGSTGQDCKNGMHDGDTKSYNGKYERSTTTCTDGVACETWGVLPPGSNKKRLWYYKCDDGSGQTSMAATRVTSASAAATAVAKLTR